MRMDRIMLCAALAIPGTALADSCGTAVTVVNHRPHPVTVTMKSFYMDRDLPAPAPDDFDAKAVTREVPAYFSRLIDIEVAAGQSSSIPFRRLCTGDFWLNWREQVGNETPVASGQLRNPNYNTLIHIGE